ncbi:hypothetical protein M2271_004720 [Streptomyces sp. LBL]|nr:hypothetical protein [Streptomyces sp. LBL]
MAHFKATTLGHPVVMGRKTWDSLPPRFRPLFGRRNIVVTRDPQWVAEGAERAGSVAQALELAGDPLEPAAPAAAAWVIGGGKFTVPPWDPPRRDGRDRLLKTLSVGCRCLSVGVGGLSVHCRWGLALSFP